MTCSIAAASFRRVRKIPLSLKNEAVAIARHRLEIDVAVIFMMKC
jgi:hypothetical protein